MNLNKMDFINALSKELSYSKEKSMIINEILENNFFISKKNKDKIVKEFVQKLEITSEEAMRIYDIAVFLINDEIKKKLRYPFKSRD